MSQSSYVPHPYRPIVEMRIVRGFPYFPACFSVSPMGDLYLAYGITRLQAKNRLLKKIGALPVWPPELLR